MDDTSFDLLCKGLSPDEAKLFRKVMKEWCAGDENSFPVQLALLTKTQLCAAASVPRAIIDSRKWLEQHLTEYRRQTQSLMEGFSQTMQIKTRDFESALSAHAKTIENTVNQIQAQLDVAEEVAGQVKSLMANATSQWEHVRARATAECERLRQISTDLDNRFAWQVVLQLAVFFLLVSGIGVLAGHYLWKH